MNQKHRPYLTTQEINYILDLTGSDQREITAKLKQSLEAKLKLLIMKLDLGLTSAAYIAKRQEKESVGDMLGFGATPEEKRELAYKKYSANSALCSVSEITLAKTYMFEHGMLTDEEVES